MLITRYKKVDGIIYALIFALLSVLFTAMAYGGSTGDAKEILTPAERLWLTNNQSRIVLAVETGYAPFVFLDAQEQPTGLAHDYIRLIESKIGASFQQRQFASLNDIFEKVHAGEVHIVNAVTKTPTRLQFLNFTEPFISVPNVILVRKDRISQISEQTLSGLKTSLVKSYAITENLANKNLGFMPDLVADDLTALLNVSFGRSDAAIIDLATASYLISHKGITNLRVAGETELSVQLAIGTPNNEPILNTILQKGLAAITDEERETIRNRWINAAGQNILTDWRLWLVLGSVLVLVLLVFIWNRSLRQQVALRTVSLIKEQESLKESEAQKLALVTQYNYELERQIAESTRELRASETRLRTIIENEPECIKIIDAQGILLEMNAAGLAMLEADRLDQIAGKPVVNVIAPEYRKAFADMHKRVIAGEPMTLEFQVVGLRGGRRWLETHAVPMQEPDGKIVHLAVTRDISERKHVEAQIQALLREQKAMLETDLVGIIKVKDRVITWANPAFEKMLGYERGELAGMPARKHYLSEDAYLTLGNDAYPILSAGNIYRTQIEHRRKNGDVIWFDMSGTLLDASIGESLWAFIDITDQVKAQTAIREAKELAEQLAKTRAEFLANMSHEIRTPMNGIIGLSQLALNQPSTPVIRDYLQKISSSSQSLLGILNDILDFSKMEAGRMSIENAPFDLDQVVDNLRNLFEERAKAQHLDFVIRISEGTPRDLVGDAIRIQQILSNLLGNAIKFTAQGHVALNIGIKHIENSRVQLTFSVEDTGIGIAKEDLGKLFLPFSQVDGTIARRFGGTGLGLAISYKLLQLMGGKFEVTRHSGQGTTFSFDLLLGIAAHEDIRETRRRTKREAGELEHELEQVGHSFRGSRVLVAEDNRVNQQVVKEFLTLSGFEVTIAGNGLETLELMEKQTFDAILMDVHMPEMDGIEATEHIRRQHQYQSIPIIALTAGVTQEERLRCLNCGMNDFVAKPVNPEELIRVLCHWIVKPKSNTTDTKPEETTQQAKQYALADLPGFDFSNILALLGGNEKLVTQLLCSFRDEIEATRIKIEAQIGQNNFGAAQKLVHTLKGSAGNLGLTELYKATEALDTILKQDRLRQDTYNNFLTVLLETERVLTQLGQM